MQNNNKSIAFVCQPYHRGGVTRWMADMATTYEKMGLDVYFVTVTPSKPFISAGKAETMIELLKNSGYQGKVITQKVNHTFELGSNNLKAAVLQSLINKNLPEGISIIVSDDYAAWLGAAATASHNKIIGVVHCSVSESYYNQCREFENQLSGIVTVSERCTHKLLINSTPVLTQPCGIVFEKNVLDVSKPKTLKLNIAWAGRLENEQKRVSDLVLIADKLKQLGLEFVLNIIGDGSAKNELMSQIKHSNLTENFVLHGWKDKTFINKILKESHIYVLPSNYEGYPVAIMEALANGCTVISSRVSGIEDLEKDSDTTEILKVYDIGNIDQASNLIFSLKEANFDFLSQKAITMAHKHFSIENCAKNYLDFIEQIHPKKTSKLEIKTNIISETIITTLKFWKYKLMHR